MTGVAGTAAVDDSTIAEATTGGCRAGEGVDEDAGDCGVDVAVAVDEDDTCETCETCESGVDGERGDECWLASWWNSSYSGGSGAGDRPMVLGEPIGDDDVDVEGDEDDDRARDEGSEAVSATVAAAGELSEARGDHTDAGRGGDGEGGEEEEVEEDEEDEEAGWRWCW